MSKKVKNRKVQSPILIVLFISILLLISCTPIIKSNPEINKNEISTQQLKKFSSVQEIKEFLRNAQINSGFVEGGVIGGIRTFDTRIMKSPSASQFEMEKSASDSAYAEDYSQTNIQVAGVDEADFVKNDGKYIYVISGNNFIVVDAFPAESAKILSKTNIKGRPSNMFINKDRAVIFSEDSADIPVIEEFDFVPRPRYTQQTNVFVYDLSDRSNPKLIKDYNIKGNYFQSRMIGEHIYFIVTDNIYFYNNFIDLPIIKSSSKTIVRPEIYYFDNPEDNYNFNTVAEFNIFEEDDKLNVKTFMMGNTNTLYVSQNYIYITYQKNLPYIYYQRHNEDRFYEVVLPLLPEEFQNRIYSIKAGKTDDGSDDNIDYEKWDEISSVLEEMYNKLDEDEKETLIEKIEKSIEEYEIKLQSERAKTVIHKIKIDNGNIEYDTRGEVPGYLLNQFSMDEQGDYFRVATTTELYVGKSVMYNNVYVLNNKLEIVGELSAIAPDERIYSTRFVGDRLYMVTFKRIDPLFVIDLSNPEKPEILGELKIPGFSDYLHPYDENYIIGVGKETSSNEWGGVSVKGVKLALFDVSEVKTPKQLAIYEIGDSGTDSEALHEHKAFLFDKKKNILAIPVREIKGKPYIDSKLGYYRQRVWQGAYVFGLTPETGFELKGKLSHKEGDENQYDYYGSPYAVRRILFMDDVLYTLSLGKIKMNSLNEISKEINEIELQFKLNYPYFVV